MACTGEAIWEIWDGAHEQGGPAMRGSSLLRCAQPCIGCSPWFNGAVHLYPNRAAPCDFQTGHAACLPGLPPVQRGCHSTNTWPWQNFEQFGIGRRTALVQFETTPVSMPYDSWVHHTSVHALCACSYDMRHEWPFFFHTLAGCLTLGSWDCFVVFYPF